MGLYQENVIESSEQPTLKQQPLTTVTNVDHAHRKKDFGSNFEIRDNSPATTRTGPVEEKKVDANRAKVLKGLDASWSMFDDSSEQQEKKENLYRIKLTGDGMGNRKETDRRHWGFDEESEKV
jgi:hypothetical protein